MSFAAASRTSVSGSESATTPQPANSRATGPSSWAHRSASPSSPLPSASIQPTGPAYRPRSMPSSSAISASAALRGVPPTAAVGCTVAARRSRVAGSSRSSLPCTSLDRCDTLCSAITPGVSGTSSSAHSGRSAAASDSTASACSRRSFSDDSSRRASVGRSAGAPASDQAVPASTRDETVAPLRRTSSSGVAPTSPSTANDQHDG